MFEVLHQKKFYLILTNNLRPQNWSILFDKLIVQYLVGWEHCWKHVYVTINDTLELVPRSLKYVKKGHKVSCVASVLPNDFHKSRYNLEFRTPAIQRYSAHFNLSHFQTGDQL